MILNFQKWPPALTGAARQPREKLVFLHGMGGTGTLWRPLAASLEDEFEILALDQRGHGKSRIADTDVRRISAGYTPLDYGQDVIDTLEQENFHPAWMIGHSMGVRTACAAASLHPSRVRGLCLIDLGFSGLAGGGLGEGLASFIGQLPLHFPSRAETKAYLEQHCPDPSIGRYLLAVSEVDRASGIVTFPFDHRALVATIYAARDVSVRSWLEVLASNGMPLLVLRGATSSVWSRSDYEAERDHFKAYPSASFTEIQGTGHGLPFEKRLEFVALLKEWISRPDFHR